MDWKKFLIAALIRAVRTFAQTFVGFIAVGAALEEIQWLRALSVSGAAAVLSILTAYVAKPKALNAGSVYDDEAVEQSATNPESATTTFDTPLEIQDLPEE